MIYGSFLLWATGGGMGTLGDGAGPASEPSQPVTRKPLSLPTRVADALAGVRWPCASPEGRDRE